ncbi:hypothetical protein [Rhodopila sp.]|uniref:hypothetical protein n=1 Tax=Rhodopila sp. TaxID=2480087 RepID=UPI003D09D937
MSEPATPVDLRAKAERYRAMVSLVSDQRIVDALISLAEEYEAAALGLEGRAARGQRPG